jgi:hypothetical protein
MLGTFPTFSERWPVLASTFFTQFSPNHQTEVRLT